LLNFEVLFCSNWRSYWWDFFFLFFAFFALFLLGWRDWGSYWLFDHDFLFFSPLLNQLRTVQSCDLVNVVYYFELELDFAATFAVSVLRLSGLDHVLRDLVWQAFQDLSAFAVVDEEVHVTEFVVKSHSLGQGEHASFCEKFFSYWVAILAESISDAYWQNVEFFNDEGGNGEQRRKHG